MLHTARPSEPSSTAVASIERIRIVKSCLEGPRPVHIRLITKSTPALAGWAWKLRGAHGLTPEKSAKGIVPLFQDPSVQKDAGIYWKHGKPVPPDPAALDSESARRQWKISDEMCGITPS
jgi:hypothetical protein